MKQAFIIAALAASVFAGGDLEDVTEALEDLANCPECVIEEGIREGQEELEREIEKLIEDLECWWADRNNGNGECRKRTREQEREDCWNREPAENGERYDWDWDS